MDTVEESGRNPASKHQIQADRGEWVADEGRDGRTCLAWNKILRRERRQGKAHFHFPCSADHEQEQVLPTTTAHAQGFLKAPWSGEFIYH